MWRWRRVRGDKCRLAPACSVAMAAAAAGGVDGGGEVDGELGGDAAGGAPGPGPRGALDCSGRNDAG